MTARNDLAALIRPHLDGGTLPDHLVGGMAAGWQAEQIADAVIAARWQPPQILTPDESAVAAILMEAGSKLIQSWSDEPKLQQIKDDIARW